MSPYASASSERPRFLRPVAALSVAVLLAGVGAAYQLEVRAGRGPSFDQGGDFLDAIPVAGADGRPYPYGDATGGTAATATTVVGATASTSGGPASTASTAGTSTPLAGTSAPPTGAAPTDIPTTEPAAPPTTLAAAPLPATGVYTYAVGGTESVSGFGARSFPGEATVVVHGDPSVPAGSLVHDLHLSNEHEERTIVAYGATGAAYTFEAGSVTFGPGTQTSQATYEPPMVQVPWPLADGASATGTSAARDPGGSVVRTEVWTTTVVGREVLDVLGTPRETWVIDIQRNTAPGGAEQVDRFRRYWYDPTLGVFVQWTERMHAERAMLVTFTFDTNYTATLTGFTPA